FSPEQRSWLNGLFAGLISLDEGVSPLSAERAAALLPDFLGKSAAEDTDDGAPWHDQTMLLGERMKLAEGRPLRRRMMAARAQPDRGQCGYNCHDYSEALFAGTEKRLNLCVPGGKETARMLKQLYEELGTASSLPAPAPAPAEPAPAAQPKAPGYSRDHPVPA